MKQIARETTRPLLETGQPRLLPGFAFAGFECATPINRHGERIDQLAATGHDRHLHEDYRRIRERGMFACREGVRWHLIDDRGRYDFASLIPFVEAGRREGIAQIWDLFHYGYPDDLDIFGEEFVVRFAEYCHSVTRMLDRYAEGPLFVTPMNEISYFAWAAGEQALFAPHRRGRGHELKIQLARAAIAGIEAIWAASPRARIVNVDPICRAVAPLDRPDLADEVEAFNTGAVFQTWDILCGRLHPELGGSRRHLDIVGVNYYWTNQWEHTRPGEPLAHHDPRRAPLHALLETVHARYGGDIVITETAHVGDHRTDWVRTLFSEARTALRRGIRLHGACFYPILGMPEWHDQDVFTPMGLWDLDFANGHARLPVSPALAALAEEMARPMPGPSDPGG